MNSSRINAQIRDFESFLFEGCVPSIGDESPFPETKTRRDSSEMYLAEVAEWNSEEESYGFRVPTDEELENYEKKNH